MMQLTSRHRRWLERRGWRTTLDYRENIIRDAHGRLVGVEPVWCAEGEQWLDSALPPFLEARATSPDEAWRGLRAAVQAHAASPASTATFTVDLDEFAPLLVGAG